MNLDNCYFDKNVVLNTVVNIKSLTRDIHNNIDNNVMEQYKNIIYESIGYIIKIHKVLHKDRVSISQVNSQKIECKITVSANLCIPCENTHIVMKIVDVNYISIKLQNGPIIGLINLANQYPNIVKIQSYFENNILVTNKQMIKFIDDTKEVYLTPANYLVCKIIKIGIYNNNYITEVEPIALFDINNKKTLNYYNAQYRD